MSGEVCPLFLCNKTVFSKKGHDTDMLLHNNKETEGKRLGSVASAHTKFLLKAINREAKRLEKKKGPGSTIEAAGSAHSLLHFVSEESWAESFLEKLSSLEFHTPFFSVWGFFPLLSFPTLSRKQ